MEKHRITKLKQGVRDENRVNVFVDGKFVFSLDISQVVDFKLKVGQEISKEELSELEKASEFGKLYQRTLEWVLIRPRSERETYDYLKKKTFEKRLDENYIGSIIEKLEDKKYLDDLKFAEWYVENRFVKKGVSRRRLEVELVKKGISREIINQVFSESERNDETEILKKKKKKRAKYDDEKLIQYLVRQGFPYELVRDLVQIHGKD